MRSIDMSTRRPVTAAAGLLLCLAASTCLAAENARGGLAALRVERAPAQPGNAVGEITVVLRNVSDKRLWVNGRMVVAGSTQPRRKREVALTITDAAGRTVPWLCREDVRDAPASVYRVLEPGQEVSARYDLSRCFPNMRPPGSYRIAAVYQDQGSKPPPAPQGTVPLTEAIEAAPFIFERQR